MYSYKRWNTMLITYVPFSQRINIEIPTPYFDWRGVPNISKGDISKMNINYCSKNNHQVLAVEGFEEKQSLFVWRDLAGLIWITDSITEIAAEVVVCYIHAVCCSLVFNISPLYLSIICPKHKLLQIMYAGWWISEMNTDLDICRRTKILLLHKLL